MLFWGDLNGFETDRGFCVCGLGNLRLCLRDGGLEFGFLGLSFQNSGIELVVS